MTISMVNNTSKVIIAERSQAELLAQLRKISYHNSSSFRVTDRAAVDEYCAWTEKDDNGIVLPALYKHGEPIFTLRANIYFSLDELRANNTIFKQCPDGFVSLPVLDMTIVATNPLYFNRGVLLALRYYMYLLHKHSVKSVTGATVKDSNIYYSLKNLDMNS